MFIIFKKDNDIIYSIEIINNNYSTIKIKNDQFIYLYGINKNQNLKEIYDILKKINIELIDEVILYEENKFNLSFSKKIKNFEYTLIINNTQQEYKNIEKLKILLEKEIEKNNE